MMNTTPLERIHLLNDLRDKYYRHRGSFISGLKTHVINSHLHTKFCDSVIQKIPEFKLSSFIHAQAKKVLS